MGVLNVTPDSFSDGGRHEDVDSAVAWGRSMIADGAAVIDVGGESTRPGAAPVTVEEELRRVVPVVERLAPECRVSIDTRHDEVARAAAAAGATLINDVGASLWEVAGELGVGWVAVHMQGQPGTMQRAPTYADVVGEVLDFLVERADRAADAGVEEVWIDPGIGFGKTLEHNLQLLAAVGRFAGTGLPVLVGTSRKSSMGVLTARSDARVGPEVALTAVQDRLEASLASATWAMVQGARMVRAHDVRSHVRAAMVVGGSIDGAD